MGALSAPSGVSLGDALGAAGRVLPGTHLGRGRVRRFGSFMGHSGGWVGGGGRGPFGSLSGASLGPRLGPFLGARLGQVWGSFCEIFWVALPLLLIMQVRPRRGGAL